jgi:hypothetical protein
MFHCWISRISKIASIAAAAIFVTAAWSPPIHAQENTQLAELYQLQAAFHAAATVHDPVNGDSAAAIDQRIRDMLAIWTADAVITKGSGANAGDYIGTGDPENPATCPAPSGNPANEGTLCTFFKYIAGSFQPGNKWVSLSPAYKTTFGIHGNTATVYFQCHYFDVSTDAAGNPLWKATAHLPFKGNAEQAEGKWLLSRLIPAPPPGIPVP